MHINFVTIKMNLNKIIQEVGKFSVIIIAVVSGLLAAWIITAIGQAVVVEGSQTIYEQELATFKSAVFDEDVIAEVVKLSANDVNIRAKLPKDRDNPFLDF